METPNYEAMLQAAQPLLAHGFRITEQLPDNQEVFGNAMLELTADDLVVRLIVDRLKRQVQVAPADAPEERADLGPVLGQLGSSNSRLGIQGLTKNEPAV